MLRYDDSLETSDTNSLPDFGNLISRIAASATKAAELPSGPPAPAFTQTFWEGSDKIKVDYDKNGNVIEPESNQAPSAMGAASQAYQKSLTPTTNTPPTSNPGSDNNGNSKSKDSSENDHQSEQDQYPKQ